MNIIREILLIGSLIFIFLLSAGAKPQPQYPRQITSNDEAYLSKYSKDIKIINSKNFIKLEGHVFSKHEKEKIEYYIRSHANEKRIYNKLIY